MSKVIDPINVWVKVKRAKLRSKDLAKMCRVSEAAVSKALAGQKNMVRLLSEIDDRATKTLKRKNL